MHATADEFERNGCTLFKLENAIHFLGPRDLAGVDAPGKTAGSAEPLAFREKCLTPLQRGFTLSAFNGDARDVRELLDEALMERRGPFGLVVVERKRAQDLAARGRDR